jgi:hypothetical protein
VFSTASSVASTVAEKSALRSPPYPAAGLRAVVETARKISPLP